MRLASSIVYESARQLGGLLQPRHCAISKFLHENSRGASSPRSCDAGRVTGGAATIPAFVIAEAHARQNLFSACHVREKERPERERGGRRKEIFWYVSRARKRMHAEKIIRRVWLLGNLIRVANLAGQLKTWANSRLRCAVGCGMGDRFREFEVDYVGPMVYLWWRFDRDIRLDSYKLTIIINYIFCNFRRVLSIFNKTADFNQRRTG